MQGKLQQLYRVSREVGQNSHLRGSIKLSQLPRLSSLVMPGDTELKLSFEFSANVFKQPSISGHIESMLFVQCQRCLEPMEYPVDLDFSLLIDASDDDVQAFQTDTVYSDDGYIDIFEVIEDELILALPLITMHDDTRCNAHWQPEVVEPTVVEKKNPFAVLESLKGKV